MALPKQSEDFPAWYQAVVKGAELAEPSLVRGTMVIRPYGFAIWERIQQAVDHRIKATGIRTIAREIAPCTLFQRGTRECKPRCTRDLMG